MDSKMIGGIEIKVRYDGESKATFFVQRQQIVWDNGKWVDSNRGKNYLNAAMREQIVKEFGLK